MQFGHLKRREFITLLGGAATWRLMVQAQQISTAVVGVLDEGSAPNRAHFMEAFRSGLATGNYIEGRNLALEFRYADGELRRLPELARNLKINRYEATEIGENKGFAELKCKYGSIIRPTN